MWFVRRGMRGNRSIGTVTDMASSNRGQVEVIREVAGYVPHPAMSSSDSAMAALLAWRKEVEFLFSALVRWQHSHPPYSPVSPSSKAVNQASYCLSWDAHLLHWMVAPSWQNSSSQLFQAGMATSWVDSSCRPVRCQCMSDGPKETLWSRHPCSRVHVSTC